MMIGAPEGQVPLREPGLIFHELFVWFLATVLRHAI